MILLQGLSGVESNSELTLLGEIVRRESARETSNRADESWLIAGISIDGQPSHLAIARKLHHSEKYQVSGMVSSHLRESMSILSLITAQIDRDWSSNNYAISCWRQTSKPPITT